MNVELRKLLFTVVWLAIATASLVVTLTLHGVTSSAEVVRVTVLLALPMIGASVLLGVETAKAGSR